MSLPRFCRSRTIPQYETGEEDAAGGVQSQVPAPGRAGTPGGIQSQIPAPGRSGHPWEHPESGPCPGEGGHPWGASRVRTLPCGGGFTLGTSAHMGSVPEGSISPAPGSLQDHLPIVRLSQERVWRTVAHPFQVRALVSAMVGWVASQPTSRKTRPSLGRRGSGSSLPAPLSGSSGFPWWLRQ